MINIFGYTFRFAVVFARLYEETGNQTFLNTSQVMYDYLWKNGWDFTMTCNGGIYFGGGHLKKITITNGQMLQLSAKLYRFTFYIGFDVQMSTLKFSIMICCFHNHYNIW